MATPADRQRITKIKEKADKLGRKGKWQKALDCYIEIHSLDKRSDWAMRKIGDTYRRLGNNVKAVAQYKRLAQLYVSNGFWAKAISTNKVVLAIDPSDNSIQQEIVQLYSNMGIHSVAPKTKQASAVAASESSIDLATKEERGEFIASTTPAGENFSVCIDLGVDETTVSDDPQEAASTDTEAQVIDLTDEAVDLDEQEVPVEHMRVPLFSDFSPEELNDILLKLSVRRFPKDTMICQQGSPGDSMYIISSGRVRVDVKFDDSPAITVAHLSTGSFFGEFGLLSDGVRHATVTADQPTEVLEITKRDFQALVTMHPRVVSVLDSYYRRRIIETLLRKNELFESLGVEQRQLFLDAFELQRLEKNTYLFRQGEASADFYFIKAGSFEVSIEKDSDVIVIAHLRPGDFFGEISLLTGKPRTATIRSETAGEVLFIKQGSAKTILDANPGLREKLQSIVAERAEDAAAAQRSHLELKKEFAFV